MDLLLTIALDCMILFIVIFAGKEMVKSSSVSSTNGRTRRGSVLISALRLYVRTCLTSPFPRLAAESIGFILFFSGESSGRLKIARSTYPIIMDKILLKSWAIPPARVPRASIFCD